MTTARQRNVTGTEMNRVRVLYIGGEGRSGSTLLAAMLGQYPGLLPVGELRGIWQAIATDELCGCGTPFSECGFWSEVGDVAFGGWARVDSEQMLRLDREYARHRRIARLLVPTIRRRHAVDLATITATMSALYLAIRRVSGCEVILDSTKDPTYAFLLNLVPEVDMRLVHLVRDSRGVAYSWQRRVARPEYANHPELRDTVMDRREPWRAAVEWDVKNSLVRHLGSRGVPRLLLRYESLLEDPDGSIDRVLSHAGLSAGDGSTHEGGEGYESLPHHTIGGNRIRFVRGKVKLRPDDEWQAAMNRRDRTLVTALSLPYLWAYGYLKPRDLRRP